MVAIKARFDGTRVVLPEEARDMEPGDVIVVFTSSTSADEDRRLWERAQEDAFARTWDNPDDAVYDAL